MISKIWDYRELNAGQKLILLAIEALSDDFPDRRVHVSRALLGEATSMHGTSVTRHINRLQRMGFLEITRETNPNGSKTLNAYRVLYPEIPEIRLERATRVSYAQH